MRLLLDTHAFLWFVADDEALSSPARSAIEDSGNEIFVSVATAWEVAIKANLGKLAVDAPSVADFFGQQMQANGFAYLPIDPMHTFRVAALPLHHRDPFDRLLIAQAIEEQMRLVTREVALFAKYGASIVW